MLWNDSVIPVTLNNWCVANCEQFGQSVQIFCWKNPVCAKLDQWFEQRIHWTRESSFLLVFLPMHLSEPLFLQGCEPITHRLPCSRSNNKSDWLFSEKTRRIIDWESQCGWQESLLKFLLHGFLEKKPWTHLLFQFFLFNSRAKVHAELRPATLSYKRCKRAPQCQRRSMHARLQNHGGIKGWHCLSCHWGCNLQVQNLTMSDVPEYLEHFHFCKTKQIWHAGILCEQKGSIYRWAISKHHLRLAQ